MQCHYARRALAALAFAAFLPPGANAADIVRGGQTYALHCAGCHGPAGQGTMPGTPRFNRGERLLQPDLALLNTIKSGRNAMPSFMGVLRDREILDAVAYIRTLQRAPAPEK